MLADDELMRGNFVMFFDKHKIGHKAIVDQVLRHSCLLMYTTEEAGELLRLLNLCTLRPTPEYEDDYIGYLVSAIYDRIKRNKTNPGTFDFSKLADYERD